MKIDQLNKEKRLVGILPAMVLALLLAGCDAADDGTEAAAGSDTSDTTTGTDSTDTGTTTGSGSVGVPDANSFSFGPETLNPEAHDEFGVVEPITVQLGDSLNSFVTDGIQVNFVAEYGTIGDSCIISDTNCSVDWLSGAPRASNYEYLNEGPKHLGASDCMNSSGASDSTHRAFAFPCSYNNSVKSTSSVAGNRGGLGQVYANRVTIMAWINNGAETFHDANGDGLFNKGERFQDVGEPFIDHNEDGVYGAVLRFDEPAIGASTLGGKCYDDPEEVCFQYGGENETYVDINGNGVFDPEGNGIYNGPLCDIEGEGCTKTGVTIFKQMVMLQSGSWARVGVTASGADPYNASNFLDFLDLQGGIRTFWVYVSDYQNGFMPEGTSIEFNTSYGKVLSGNCKVESTAAYGFTNCPVTLEVDDDPGAGVFTVSVESPGGNRITYSYGVSD